ncbi:MAG: hypothetical protein ACRECV_10345 [Xanthobacteraceae bacterium]
MATDTLPTPAEPKRRRVPAKVREAIDHYVSGRAKNITAAAKKVGMSREGLSRALSRPDVTEFLKQKAARQVALGAGRASARMIQLMDAKSEHVSADMARHVAAIAGIRPASDAQLNVNVDVRAGFVIRLTDPDATQDSAPPRDVISGATAALPVPDDKRPMKVMSNANERPTES